ncbi:MAG: tetratricopeptide repeat protein [Acidibrevibacterium sp.]|uniref:tetratricopeptide repeat protein n=1 Tax=Acidibrevibacterium sp. TaxID=2606776 RepID=UPI003D064CD7
MSDIFQEVDEDLRAERARRLLFRYGGWLIAAALAVLAATGAFEYRQWRQRQADEKLAARYLDAVHAATAEPADTKQALAGFAAIIPEAGPGYRDLAALQQAALLAKTGHLPEALAIWDRLANASDTDRLLARLAALLSVQHQLDNGDPAMLATRLTALESPDDPYRALATEMRALLALRLGKRDDAKKIFSALLHDEAAPPGLRQRAGALLAELGG